MVNSVDILFDPFGHIYHLGIRPEHLADFVLTVGDPGRVPAVSKYLDSIDFRGAHREFISHRGYRKGKSVLVISTGMGTDNIEILLNELYILAAIDPSTKKPLAQARPLKVIRLGTSGSVSEKVKEGDLLLSAAALGFDQLDKFYKVEAEEWTSGNKEVKAFFQQQAGLHSYYAEADPSLFQEFSKHFKSGITLTLPGFYLPQGRSIPQLYDGSNILEMYRQFQLHGQSASNIEMETSGYYHLGRYFGIPCLSVNAILASRLENRFYHDPESLIDQMIEKTFEIVDQL